MTTEGSDGQTLSSKEQLRQAVGKCRVAQVHTCVAALVGWGWGWVKCSLWAVWQRLCASALSSWVLYVHLHKWRGLFLFWIVQL